MMEKELLEQQRINMSYILGILGMILGLSLCIKNPKLNKPIVIGGGTLFGFLLTNILTGIFYAISIILFLIFIFFVIKGYFDAKKEIKEEINNNLNKNK